MLYINNINFIYVWQYNIIVKTQKYYMKRGELLVGMVIQNTFLTKDKL